MDIVLLSLLLTLGRHFHVSSFSVPPEKNQKVFVFMMFSTVIEKGHLAKID